MASPLVGMTGVNALLFASYGAAKRIVSPFPELSIGQTAIAGGMAGAANTVLASPGGYVSQVAYARLILSRSRVVQNSHAGPVWHVWRQEASACSFRAVVAMGLPPRYHAWFLGSSTQLYAQEVTVLIKVGIVSPGHVRS
jgi:hypothetical protein